jgi:TolA-binding protein
MMMCKWRFLLLLPLAMGTVSCIALKRDLDATNREVTRLEGRITKVESETSAARDVLTEMIGKARAQVEQLEGTLTKATRVLARNSADFGAEMETIKDQLRKLEGQLAEMSHGMQQSDAKFDATTKKIAAVAAAAGLDVPVDAEKIPADKAAHLSAVRDAFSTGRHGEVRSLGQAFIDRYPKDKNADAVHLLMAKAYIEQKQWAKALGVLGRFNEKYPSSVLNPEALYEMARCFYELGDCTDARSLVDALQSRHAKSPFAAKAKTLSEQMKKDKSRCAS